MPRGDKSKYTNKQERQARHIEEGYEDRGVSKDTAQSRAWATVNKMSGGGKKSGSGRGKSTNTRPAQEGGRKGGSSTRGNSKSGSSSGRSTTNRSTTNKSSSRTTSRSSSRGNSR